MRSSGITPQPIIVLFLMVLRSISGFILLWGRYPLAQVVRKVKRMSIKPKGKCSFCKQEVTPVVLEENSFRRDKCMCPNCKEIIYLCRYFGCDNYARGGDLYDDELCSHCASDISKSSGSVIKTGVSVIVGLAIKSYASKK